MQVPIIPQNNNVRKPRRKGNRGLTRDLALMFMALAGGFGWNLDLDTGQDIAMGVSWCVMVAAVTLFLLPRVTGMCSRAWRFIVRLWRARTGAGG